MKKIVILSVFLFASIITNAQSKVFGNKYMKQEGKYAHSFALNIGYNHIDNNNIAGFGKTSCLPVGFYYELSRNGFLYGKIKYANYGFKTIKLENMLNNDVYKNAVYTAEGFVSQHLISFSFGLINSSSITDRFSFGVSGGYLLEMGSVTQTIQYYIIDTLKTDKFKENLSGNDIYLGVETSYRHYLSDRLFIGLEGSCGYFMNREKICYSLGGILGWTFTKKKNYRF